MHIKELHQRALEAAREYFRAEAKLLDLLQKIDACKGFRNFGYTSLFSYAVDGLKLSESTSLNLINVARKAVQVPALKTEIEAGQLSVCKARKIVPVLTTQNQAEWIEKAKTLPTRKLEREIARVAPGEAFPERIRFVTESRVNLSFSLDEQTLEKIKRVQDLESQRRGRVVTLEETLAAMSALYIERNDTVAKAERALAKNGLGHTDVTRQTGSHKIARNAKSVEKLDKQTFGNSLRTRQPIPTAVEHEVVLRDAAQCTATNTNGNRCERRRFLHVHHIKPVSLGGENSPENLTTLCSSHHRIYHAVKTDWYGSREIRCLKQVPVLPHKPMY